MLGLSSGGWIVSVLALPLAPRRLLRAALAGVVLGMVLLRLGVRGAVPASMEDSLVAGLAWRLATAKGSFLSSHLKRR